jgi:hypothetical protein
MALFFQPLRAIDKPLDLDDKIEREVERLASPAGLFDAIPHRPDPRGLHNVDLTLDLRDWHEFEAFVQGVRGMWKPFFYPAYNVDLKLASPVGPDDETITIKFSHYTDFEFPSLNRRSLAFVLSNGCFYFRTVTDSVDNGNGTETLTLSSPLEVDFTDSGPNYISYLWWVRFGDDAFKYSWIHEDLITISLGIQEIFSDIPSAELTSCNNPSIPICDSTMNPLSEYWDYATEGETLTAWPVISVSGLCGSFAMVDCQFVASILACGTIGSPGSAVHRKLLFVPAGTYRISAVMTQTPDQGLQPNSVTINGHAFTGAGPGSGGGPGFYEITLAEAGTLDIRINLSVPFVLGTVDEKTFITTVSPVIVQKI